MARPKGYIEAGYIDVDAGSIWIGDGCYVLKDSDEARPKDLGANWHDICDRFFDRSGYRAREVEWSDWYHQMRMTTIGKSDEERDNWIKDHPFTPSSVDKGFANFTHDNGFNGMGMMISTNYGDGSYPVYIKYGKNGRPSKILIDFGDL